jgi:S-formylglutathione hydrolase
MFEQIEKRKCFEGYVYLFKHKSATLGCEMKFRVFLPKEAETGKVPAIYYLAGLTCTDETFITKGCAIEFAARYGIALICPDTSPRGVPIEGDSESWDFGVGAGFYIDSTVEKWKTNYNMQSYITTELYSLVLEKLQIDEAKISIMGHSMGGHGALVLYLKNQRLYKSVSAFAPICHPSASDCAWGQKAFKGYFGDDKNKWSENDATCLVEHFKGEKVEILIDQGDQDPFYIQKQLQPESFDEACKKNGYPVQVRMQKGYDHSYYFIQTFMEDHIEFHAKHLK